jgi:hypothetical protein
MTVSSVSRRQSMWAERSESFGAGCPFGQPEQGENEADFQSDR